MIALVLVGDVVVVRPVFVGLDAVVCEAVLEGWAACVAVACVTAPAIPGVLELLAPPPHAASASGQAKTAIRAPMRIALSSQADLWRS
jgi:hypothetical protein